MPQHPREQQNPCRQMGYRKHGCKRVTLATESQCSTRKCRGQSLSISWWGRPKHWVEPLRSHSLWEPSCLWTPPALGSSVGVLVWHRAVSLVSPWQCHLQISQWINHQPKVHSRDPPHTTSSKAKDAAVFFTTRKLPCLLRPTKIFTGKSQQSVQWAGYFQSLQQINFYKYFCFSSCSRGTNLKLGWVSLVGASSLFSSFGLISENGISFNLC